MPTAIRRRPARLALLTATALAAGALGVVPAAPASAVQTGGVQSGTLVWGLSTYLSTAATGSISALASGYVAPASFNSETKLSSFTVESATIESDGGAVINLDGAALAYAPTGNRWLKFDDLVVDVDSAGNGDLSALVSYGPGVGSYPASSYDPTVAPFRGPTRVEIVELDGNTASENTVTKDVSSFPALNGTWSPALITFLAGDATADPAVPGLSYRSQLVNDDPAKAPQPLNISIDLAVAATTASFGTATGAGVPVAVEGTGFKKTAPGVYVSLREYAAGAAAYAGGAVWSEGPTAWVSNDAADVGPDPATGASASIDDAGAFSTSLLLTPAALEALDPTKLYSVVTRKAHGQGTIPTNADQISESPLDVSSLKAATTVVATAAATLRGNPLLVDVDVRTTGAPATGTVTVKNGATTVGTGTLSGSVAQVQVDLPAGTHALTVEYPGNSAFWSSTGSVTMTVRKRLTDVTLTVPTNAVYGRGRTVEVSVPGATGAVTLSGAGATRTGTLSAGKVSFAIPAELAAGAHPLTATYAGDADNEASTGTRELWVLRAPTKTVVGVKSKPTVKKTGKAAVRGLPRAKIAVVVKQGNKTVKRLTVRLNGAGKGVVTLPKAPKGGKFVVTAFFNGDANHDLSNDRAGYAVKKPKKR